MFNVSRVTSDAITSGPRLFILQVELVWKWSPINNGCSFGDDGDTVFFCQTLILISPHASQSGATAISSMFSEAEERFPTSIATQSPAPRHGNARAALVSFRYDLCFQRAAPSNHLMVPMQQKETGRKSLRYGDVQLPDVKIIFAVSDYIVDKNNDASDNMGSWHLYRRFHWYIHTETIYSHFQANLGVF